MSSCIVCNQVTRPTDGTFWNDFAQSEEKSKATLRVRLEHVLGKSVDSRGWLCQRCQEDLTQIEVLLTNFRKRYWKTFCQKRDAAPVNRILQNGTNRENLLHTDLLTLVPVLGGAGTSSTQTSVGANNNQQSRLAATAATGNAANPPAFITEIKNIILDSRAALQHLERTAARGRPLTASTRRANVDNTRLLESNLEGETLRTFDVKSEPHCECDFDCINSEDIGNQQVEKHSVIRQGTNDELHRPRPEKSNQNSDLNTLCSSSGVNNPVRIPEDETLSSCSTRPTSFSLSARPKHRTMPCSVYLGERVCLCDICKMPFHRKHDLRRHMKNHARGKVFTCKVCSRTFNDKGKFKGHMQRMHNLLVKGLDDIDTDVLMEELNELADDGEEDTDVEEVGLDEAHEEYTDLNRPSKHCIAENTPQKKDMEGVQLVKLAAGACGKPEVRYPHQGPYARPRGTSEQDTTSSSKCYKFTSSRYQETYKVTHKSREGNYICDICKETFSCAAHVTRHIILHKMKR